MTEVHILVMDDRYYDAGEIVNLIAFEDKDAAEAKAALLKKTIKDAGRRPIAKAFREPGYDASRAAQDVWDQTLREQLEAILKGASDCNLGEVDYSVTTLDLVPLTLPPKGDDACEIACQVETIDLVKRDPA